MCLHRDLRSECACQLCLVTWKPKFVPVTKCEQELSPSYRISKHCIDELQANGMNDICCITMRLVGLFILLLEPASFLLDKGVHDLLDLVTSSNWWIRMINWYLHEVTDPGPRDKQGSNTRAKRTSYSNSHWLVHLWHLCFVQVGRIAGCTDATFGCPFSVVSREIFFFFCVSWSCICFEDDSLDVLKMTVWLTARSPFVFAGVSHALPLQKRSVFSSDCCLC